MKKLLLLPVMFLLLFASCKKDKTPVTDTTLTPAMARDSLYYIMKDWYLWYNLMPTVNKDDYPDPYKLLEAMRYQALDRWSYILTADEYNAQINGTFVGHGFRIGLDTAGVARIAMVYNNSALYAFGVRRGWIVKKINGTEIAPLLLDPTLAAYTALIGPSQAGITNTFLFEKPDGTEATLSATKSTFLINTVLLTETLQLSSGTTGHLVFESFFPPAPTELAAAFADFSSNGIKDLILDLRYNSGGYLEIAQMLASYIAGNARSGSVFANLTYNDRHQEANMNFPFITTPTPLSVQKIVVITTRNTASASEDVINGLRPFFDVVCIGDTTNGKPTGMNGWDIGHQYYMFPVTFKVVNSAGQGEFFDGIFPAKVLGDDITRDFNDQQEICLKEAINYLETGSISAKSGVTFKRYPQVSEKPEWMNNAIIKSK